MTDAERLERYDRLYADLLAEQARTAAEIEKLKAAGRERSATCRQLLGNKLTLQNFLGRFEVYGLAGRRDPAENGEGR